MVYREEIPVLNIPKRRQSLLIHTSGLQYCTPQHGGGEDEGEDGSGIEAGQGAVEPEHVGQEEKQTAEQAKPGHGQDGARGAAGKAHALLDDQRENQHSHRQDAQPGDCIEVAVVGGGREERGDDQPAQCGDDHNQYAQPVARPAQRQGAVEDQGQFYGQQDHAAQQHHEGVGGGEVFDVLVFTAHGPHPLTRGGVDQHALVAHGKQHIAAGGVGQRVQRNRLKGGIAGG